MAKRKEGLREVNYGCTRIIACNEGSRIQVTERDDNSTFIAANKNVSSALCKESSSILKSHLY